MSTPLLSSWVFWALLSAVFAAMTAIYRKSLALMKTAAGRGGGGS